MKKIKLKYYPQNDRTDCAAACIKMILEYYGTTIPLQQLRDSAGTNKFGTTVADVIKVFKKYNFDCIAIKADSRLFLEDNIELPIMVHTIRDGLLHFEVIYGVEDDILFVVNPDVGKYKISIDEFLKIWESRIAILAEPNCSYRKKKIQTRGLITFLPIVLRQRKNIYVALVSSMIVTFITLFNYNFWELLLDGFIPKRQIDPLIIFSIAIVFLNFFKFIVAYYRDRMIISIGQFLNIQITKEYFKHILFLPYSFFADRHSGDLISRFNDSNKIISFLGATSVAIILDFFTLLIVGTALVLKSPILFGISVVILPIYVTIILIFFKKIEAKYEQSMITASKINSKIIESIEGIQIIKTNVIEDEIYEQLTNQYEKFISQMLSAFKLDSFQMNLKNFFNEICIVIVLCVGALQVINEQISLGDLVFFYSMLGFFYTSIGNLVNLQVQFQSAELASKRVVDILSLPKERQGGKIIKHFKNNIILRNVSVEYGNKKVLSEINLTIVKNKKIAIVGESGSGKSTLAKVLASLIRSDEGDILIDDRNIRGFEVRSLRRLIHFVPQETYFFKGSVRDNIFQNKKIDPDKIAEAFEVADIVSFLDKTTFGIESDIESNGMNLSGGQKKRLALARALLSESEVIIFDEITNGLSSKQEHKIIHKLTALDDRTIIFITHSNAIPEYCDEIWELANGRISLVSKVD